MWNSYAICSSMMRGDFQFIFVCTGKDCRKAGAKALAKDLKHQVKRSKFKKTKVIKTKCTGRCEQAPIGIIGNQWITNLTPKKIEKLVEGLEIKEN